MKTIDYVQDDCPTYALSYLVNGDASGMEDSDIAECDEWYDRITTKLKKQYPGAMIQFLTSDDETGSFNRNPAFGLACDTVDCAFAVWVDNEDPRPDMRLPWEPEPIEPDEPGAIETAIRECLEFYPSGTRFDCIAHTLQRYDDSWSTNDSWFMLRDADLESAIEAIAGRWHVWQANYCEDARASDLEDTGDGGVSYMEACGVPFMEIQAALEDGEEF